MVWLSEHAPLVAGLFAFALGVLFVYLTRLICTDRGWVFRPSADRWSRSTVAMCGGVPIYLAFSLSTFVFQTKSLGSGWSIPLIGGMMMLLGLVDDILKIKPSSKLLGQLVGAALAVYLGHRFDTGISPIVDLVISIFWFLTITNAVNLMDNMDGLASGISAISLVFVTAVFAHRGQSHFATTSAALLGSVLAFLVFNYPPASIFMGDCGSMFLGVTLGMLTAHGGPRRSVILSLVLPCLFLLVPLADMIMVSVTRILRGRSIAQGGRDHSSHRLVLLGLTEKRAVIVLWAQAALAGAAGFWFADSPKPASLLAVGALIVSYGLFKVFIYSAPVKDKDGRTEDQPSGLRRPVSTLVMMDITYKRRIFEIFLDLVLIVFCYMLATALRFDFDIPSQFSGAMVQTLPLTVICGLTSFFAFGLYRGIWRYMGTQDVWRFFVASGIATLSTLFFAVEIYRFEAFSRSVFVLYWVFLFLALAASRFSLKVIGHMIVSLRPMSPSVAGVLLYGAGEAGEVALRHIATQDCDPPRQPVGFIDDNEHKHGSRIRGYAVLGGLKDLARIHDTHKFRQLLLTTDKLEPARVEEAMAFCRERGIMAQRFRMSCEDVSL